MLQRSRESERARCRVAPGAICPKCRNQKSIRCSEGYPEPILNIREIQRRDMSYMLVEHIPNDPKAGRNYQIQCSSPRPPFTSRFCMNPRSLQTGYDSQSSSSRLRDVSSLDDKNRHVAQIHPPLATDLHALPARPVLLAAGSEHLPRPRAAAETAPRLVRVRQSA